MTRRSALLVRAPACHVRLAVKLGLPQSIAGPRFPPRAPETVPAFPIATSWPAVLHAHRLAAPLATPLRCYPAPETPPPATLRFRCTFALRMSFGPFPCRLPASFVLRKRSRHLS